MKKLMAAVLALSLSPLAFAGGVLTNTNQSARFGRYMALEATRTIDGAYYNPAGLSALKEGFHFSISNQSAFQKRKIASTFPLYQLSLDRQTEKKYEGTASAPIIPSIQAAYRKGKWTLSGTFAIVGGGGKATFNNGLPMFEAGMASMPLLLGGITQALQAKLGVGTEIGTTGYSVDQYMTGSNFIYGAQIGGTYKVNDMFSVYAGVRLNIARNHYKGYLRELKAGLVIQNGSDLDPILNQIPGLAGTSVPDLDGSRMVSPELIFKGARAAFDTQGADQDMLNTLNLFEKAASTNGAHLDSKQSGWGLAPILGVNFTYKGLNIGAKYEFRTKLNVENKTVIDDTGYRNNGMFANGVNTAHDVPALFTIGAEYQFTKNLKAAFGYHHFFDKSAKISNNRQNHISGTNEYLGGIEYRLNRMFAVSMGGQLTRYEIKDQQFQTDLSFSVNSYSLGFGGSINVAPNILINVGYFFTDYTNFKTREVKGQLPDGTALNLDRTYTRTNKVFTAGVEFSF